jgi:hypothetical protein
MALISKATLIKYTVLVGLVAVLVVLALYATGYHTMPSRGHFDDTQKATAATLARRNANPDIGNTGQHILSPSMSAQPPTSIASVPASLVPPQDQSLALRQMAPFSAPDGTKVMDESIATKRVALAKPLPPPAARSNAPGTGTVEQAQKEYVQAMAQDPSAVQTIEHEYETKAFKQRTGVETGVYALMMQEARASGALPNPALKIDCRGVLLIGLPQGHPCLEGYRDAIIAETPALFVKA